MLYKLVSQSATAHADARRAAEGMQLEVMGSMVRLEHELLEIADALTGHGIECAVVKGLATAHLDYSEPEMRQSGDVDLLISPDHLDSATKLLAEVGWKQMHPLPRHHEAFTHAITLRRRRGPEIDLHQRIAHRAVGWQVPTNELLSSGRNFKIANVDVMALSDPDRIVHAALHDVMSRAPYHRLSSTADVLVLTSRHPDLAQEVLERAARWGVSRLVASAVEHAYQSADLPVPQAWQTRTRAALRGRPLLIDRAYLSEQRRPVLEEIAFIRAIGGSRMRSRYVAGYLFPDPEYAQRRQRFGVRAQARYLWSRIRST